MFRANTTLTGILGAAQGLFGILGAASTGVTIVSVLNALVGVLGLAGVNLGNLNLNRGTGANIVNIGVAVLGIIFTFLKGKKS